MRCENIVQPRGSRFPRKCSRSAVEGSTLCGVCASAKKRAASLREQAESTRTTAGIQRLRTARKVAAFDDLLEAGEELSRKLTVDSVGEMLNIETDTAWRALDAAISKAKEAQK